jgi:predicted dehydrogenase
MEPMHSSVLPTPTTGLVSPLPHSEHVEAIIVGGSSGVTPRHLEAFDAHPSTNVDALVEPDHSRAELLRQRHPHLRIIDDVPRAPQATAGLAVVCVPDAAHAEVVTTCLDRGWHVLCEKPLTDDIETASELFTYAERVNRYLGVAYQRRFMLQDLAQQLTTDVLGELHCVDARWLRRAGHPASRQSLEQRGSGVRGDLIPHLLSQTLPFLGSGPLSVQARDWQVSSGWFSEDVARMTVRDSHGIELKIDVAYDSPHLHRSDDCWIEFYGALGTVHVEMPTHQDEHWATSNPPMLYPRSGSPRALCSVRTASHCHLLQAEHVAHALTRGPASEDERDRELALVRTTAAAHASATWAGTIIPVHGPAPSRFT